MIETYATASRERERLRETIGARAFGAMWDENAWHGWARGIVNRRLYDAVVRERWDEEAARAERFAKPVAEYVEDDGPTGIAAFRSARMR